MLRIRHGEHSISVTGEGETPVYSVDLKPSEQQPGATEMTLVIPTSSIGYVRPPRGIIPRSIWMANCRQDRALALKDAIQRYKAAGCAVLPEWEQELAEIEKTTGKVL